MSSGAYVRTYLRPLSRISLLYEKLRLCICILQSSDKQNVSFATVFRSSSMKWLTAKQLLCLQFCATNWIRRGSLFDVLSRAEIWVWKSLHLFCLVKAIVMLVHRETPLYFGDKSNPQIYGIMIHTKSNTFRIPPSHKNGSDESGRIPVDTEKNPTYFGIFKVSQSLSSTQGCKESLEKWKTPKTK